MKPSSSNYRARFVNKSHNNKMMLKVAKYPDMTASIHDAIAQARLVTMIRS